MSGNSSVANFFRASAEDFKKIPGSPVAYWVGKDIQRVFSENKKIGEIAEVCAGHQTGDNHLFLRLWYEVSRVMFTNSCKNRIEAKESNVKWYPHNKGGAFRKWYGNLEYIINWLNDGVEIRHHPSSALRNTESMFKQGITWSHTTSGSFGARFSPVGSTFNVEGPTLFHNNSLYFLGFLCSSTAIFLITTMNQTLHFLVGTISKIPIIMQNKIFPSVIDIVSNLVQISKSDWDSYETSWDFTDLPLLRQEYRKSNLEETYKTLRSHWQDMALEMQRLEEENNRIFVEAYGLQDELTPEVPLEEITLTCNPYYRYGGKKSDAELEALLLADTMREYISYAVGCIFGRYSLDKEGLVLANAGEGNDDYLEHVPNPTFMPDRDGILPVTEEDDFPDDLAGRFRDFLKLTFGEEHFLTNLRFIEQALGKDIRSYFLRDFYKDHVRRYKNRPIYWMISSPKGSFRCLIYLHRYTRNTVGLFLDNYLRPYQRKLEAKEQNLEHTIVSPSAGTAEKARARKLQEKLRGVKNELELWQRDVVYPLATQRIELDLDDGVKVNYGKLGLVLEKVKGLNG